MCDGKTTTTYKDDLTILATLCKELERRRGENDDDEEMDEDNTALLSAIFDICEANVSSHKMIYSCLRAVLYLYKTVAVDFPTITERDWDRVALQRKDDEGEEEDGAEGDFDDDSDWDEASIVGSSRSNHNSVKLMIQHRILRLCALYVLHQSSLFTAETAASRSKSLRGLVQYVMSSLVTVD